MEALRETYPPLFRRHARRPRLTRMLDASTAQTILVTAPAGYGKTTLATEWVQGRDDVVWYRATSGSADVAAFSAGLADVMAPLVPGVGDRLKQRLRVADTPERAARPLAEILSEDLETWPPDALLIIDDYHLVVDSAPVEEFMDWLLMLTPALARPRDSAAAAEMGIGAPDPLRRDHRDRPRPARDDHRRGRPRPGRAIHRGGAGARPAGRGLARPDRPRGSVRDP